MNEILENLIKKYKETDWKTLLKEDHGKYNLQEIKPHLDFIKNFIDNLIKNRQLLPHGQKNKLSDLIRTFLSFRNRINNYEGKSQRNTVIQAAVSFKNWILDDFLQLESSLNIQNKYSSLDKREKGLKYDKSENLSPQIDKLFADKFKKIKKL